MSTISPHFVEFFFHGMARYRRRKALGKRQVRAVKAIVRNLPETKVFWDYITPTRYLFSSTSSFLSDRTGRFLIPIHANIPKIKNTLTETNISVIGDEFYSRGVAITLWCIVSGNSNYRVRVSVVSSIVPPVLGLGPFAITNTNYDWMESQTAFSQPTLQHFGDGVNVLKTRTIAVNTDGGVARKIRIWCPITGKKECYRHESPAVNSYVGALTGRNYYIMVEWFSSMTGAPSSNDNLNVLGEFRVYFKDA